MGSGNSISILGNSSKNSLLQSQLSRPNCHIFLRCLLSQLCKKRMCVQLTQKAVCLLEEWSLFVKDTHYFTSHSWSNPKEPSIVQAVYSIGLCEAAATQAQAAAALPFTLCQSDPRQAGMLAMVHETQLVLLLFARQWKGLYALMMGYSWSSNRSPDSLQIDISEPVESCWWITFIRRAWPPSIWQHHKAIRLIGYCLLII